MVCIRKSVGVFFAKCRLCLGIYTGVLGCIAKLPEEVCASHTKRVGENKKVLQLKLFAEVLLTGLTLKKFYISTRRSHMANNIESSSAGSKRRQPSSEDPAPLPNGSPSKLDSTIEAILRKKVRERLDIEKSHSSLLARIKLLEKHAADGTTPSGLRIQRVKAKGQDAETLQAKFDAVIREAEFKLLDAATASLRVDVEVHREAI